jgi:hypothetical protein
MRRVLIGVVIALAAIVSYPAAVALGGEDHHSPPTTTSTGGGHTPVTICHKPGTPAQQELVVDDDSVELTGHLGHGDTIGPCPPPDTTTTTTTEEPPECPNGDHNGELPGCEPETTTTVTETQPPPSGDCPPGMIHDRGHDGNQGNDDCCFPGVNCDGDTPPPTNETTTTQETTTTVEPPPVVTDPGTTEETTTSENTPTAAPPVKAKPKPKPDKAPPVKKHVKPVRVCKPGAVETTPCGVQGSG